MKDYRAKLVPGGVYHVYNRAIGDEQLFRNEKNYEYFLRKYQDYINPVADALAYCLMPNHFHFVIQIKSENEILLNFDQKIIQKWLFDTSFKVYEQYLNRKINYRFSHFFNAYAQAYNKMYERKGSLFIRSYNRILIESDSQLRQAIIYIHINPVKDGFAKTLENWKFSSYQAYLSMDSSFVNTNFGIELFDSVQNFEEIIKQTLQGL